MKSMNHEIACRVAVLIPCFNESSTIGGVIREYREALPDAEIYVYDNASTDGTAEMAAKNCVTVGYEPLRGKANVVRRMFREVDADCYVMVDGDQTYSAGNVARMVEMVCREGYDMVVGDRLSSNYLIENDRACHGMGNMLVRWMVNSFWHQEIPDVMSGLRVMSRRFVKLCPVTCSHFEIETEMTIHAIDAGFVVGSVPVVYRNRPENSVSKLSTLRDGVRIVAMIFRKLSFHKPGVYYGTLAAASLAAAVVVWLVLDSVLVASLLLLAGGGLLLCGRVVGAIAYATRVGFELKSAEYEATEKSE